MSSSRAYGRPSAPQAPSVNWFGLIQVGTVMTVGFLAWYIHGVIVTNQQNWSEVEEWLQSHGIEDCQFAVKQAGLTSLDIVNTVPLPLDYHRVLLPREQLERLEAAVRWHQEEVTMRDWLSAHELMMYSHRLRHEGVTSLAAVSRLTDRDLQTLTQYSSGDLSGFKAAVDQLRALGPDVDYREYFGGRMTGLSFGAVLVLLALLCVAAFVGMNVNSAYALFRTEQRRKRSLLAYMTGQYLSPGMCRVEWGWTEPQTVGTTLSFTVKLVQGNGRPCPAPGADPVCVEVTVGSVSLSPAVTVADPACVRVAFTVHRAGAYRITVTVSGRHVARSPYTKHFLPGPLVASKSVFVGQGSVLPCTVGKTLQLVLEPRDEYGNLCHYDQHTNLADSFQLEMIESTSQVPTPPEVHCSYNPALRHILLTLIIDAVGCYETTAKYQGTLLGHGQFYVIVLSESEMSVVTKLSSKRSPSGHYEARLLSTHYHSPSDRGKKVYCYLSPRQLTLKEFTLKIIPRKLFTFRVCPSTKFQFLGTHNQLHLPILSIEDGAQSPVLLALRERNVVTATFSNYLRQNIGGSETFADKQEFFYREVRQLHSKRVHGKSITLRICRQSLLESSVKATKHLSTNDWCKSFEIIFQQEEGLDWGGLRREWFELVCTEIFDPKCSQLFMSFRDDPQALVHPNSQRPAALKLKHYEFAGRLVGKCLYESAQGGSYRQLVKAKFTRAFLAQLIGLRVNYKYFSSDDPDLYTSKVCYLEDADVDDLDMTFTEEEFCEGRLDKVVELVPGGAQMAVTNTNKLRYLDALAQYRLVTRVRPEVDAFLRGLSDLVPDALLSMFDENELELLLCGTGEFSVEDFRQHHTVCGGSADFSKVLAWFWTLVAGYTREEMARLLQFTTGCSQLPPGGFSQLVPKLQLTAAPTFNVLPTAHTCFNQLCLPDYESLQSMHRALKLAITEGNQGFGMV